MLFVVCSALLVPFTYFSQFSGYSQNRFGHFRGAVAEKIISSNRLSLTFDYGSVYTFCLTLLNFKLFTKIWFSCYRGAPSGEMAIVDQFNQFFVHLEISPKQSNVQNSISICWAVRVWLVPENYTFLYETETVNKHCAWCCHTCRW